WNALTGIYIRFGDLDTADARYQDLLRDHEELYQGEPEYMYRAYLDFIREYRRDLKNALRCFLDGKDKFDDKAIADFWELELMLMTATFNEPERFEKERYPFMEDGLIEPEVYYHNALAAYTANLNAPKAGEMFRHLTPQMDALTREEAFYLAWQKQLRPAPDEHWDGMVPRKIDAILAQYRKEAWRGAAMRDKLVNRLRLERVCCLDAWALYLLAESGQLEALEDMDRVYIPHCTIQHLLCEICAFPNIPVHMALAYISAHDNMCIYSPDFAHQLKVRDKVRYDEPACVTALALEKDCPAVIGEPNMDEALAHAFPARILRPTDAFDLE
ncbi:MAG: hypothetical protein SPG79_06260, partial [Candidatus Faecousia sp.]|nr:hypothetical protein [Candidatus Faecousia sp.]